MQMYKIAYSVEKCRLGLQFFQFIIEIDQLETTKSHMFIMPFRLKLTDHKCLTGQ